MAVIGEAVVVVKADARGFDKGLEKNLRGAGTAAAVSDKQLRGFTSSTIGARRFSQALTTQAGALGGALSFLGPEAIVAGAGLAFLATAAGKAVSAASALEEQQNKTNVVFGDSAGVVSRFAEEASTAIGQSERAALQGAATFGNLFRAIGLTEDASAGMSVELTTLASDLASFNDISPDEALQALRSGLVGEIEPLRRLGVSLDEATLKQKALDLGLVTTTKGTLPASVKAQAAYAAILEQTTLAQGDFANTSDSLANAQRSLQANIEDLQASLGEVLLPAVAEGVGLLTDLVGVVNNLSDILPGAGLHLKDFAKFLPGIGPLASAALGIRDLVSSGDELGDTNTHVGKTYKELTQRLAEESAAAAKNLDLTKEQVKLNDEAAKSQIERIKAEVSARNAEEDYREALLGVTEAQQDIVEANEESARSILDAQRAVVAAKRSYEDAQLSVRNLTDALEDQRKANERLKESVPKAQFDLTKAREGEVSAVDELRDAEEELRQLRRFVETTPEQIQEAEEKVRQARLGVTQASFGTKDAERELADLRQQIADGPERIAEAERSIQRARSDLILQAESVKESERAVGAARVQAADDAKAAQQGLADAQARVGDTALASADAAVTLARETAEASGKVFTAAEANQVYREKLDAIASTLAPKNPLRTRLRDYAGEIDSVPPFKETKFKLDTTEAEKKLDRLDRRFQAFAGSAVAAVGGDAISGGVEGATITVEFNADIEGTAKAVAKQNGGAKR